MRRLFESDPLLAKWIQRENLHGLMMRGGKIPQAYAPHVLHAMVNVAGTPGNRWFMPLIASYNGLGCHLDIKFMRPGMRGNLFPGGDLDNRLKTLFDGLRMPREPQEIPDDGWLPDPAEKFFCLLEDDALITGFQVATEPLLTPATDSASEVRLEIGVKVVVLTINEHNQIYRE
jgi:hypothetical protein